MDSGNGRRDFLFWSHLPSLELCGVLVLEVALATFGAGALADSGKEAIAVNRAAMAAPVVSSIIRKRDSAGGFEVFIEGDGGAYVPLPKARGLPASGIQRFVVDLANGVDLADIAGKPLRLTMVSERGQAEVMWTAR